MDAIHKKFIDRVHIWIRAHPKATIAIVGVLTAITTLLVTTIVLLQAPKQVAAPVAAVKEAPPLPVYYSPLTGIKVKDEKSLTKPVTAIMIENSPDARPQSGLKSAEVVYEAIAEGGITRFLALYQQHKPKLIGPVRSLRMYYVDWLTPYNPSIAHVGGSHRALQTVRNGKYRDIDQFFNAGSYWRATDRWAPHNVYTNFQKLDTLNKQKGYTSSKFTAWPRTDGKPAKKKTATSISVTISGPLFDSSYTYDAKSNSYVRYQAGAPHLDREAGKITPTVVIVLDTVMHRVFEDGYRESIKTTGSGRARIFQGGAVIQAKWIKKDRKSQIKFVDKKGEEVELFRGQTWITAVPANQGGKVTWRATK